MQSRGIEEVFSGPFKRMQGRLVEAFQGLIVALHRELEDRVIMETEGIVVDKFSRFL